MVNITYSSTMDGEDFDGCSGEDVDIQLGAGYLEGDKMCIRDSTSAPTMGA